MPPDKHFSIREFDRTPLVPESVLAKRWRKSVRTLQRWRAEGYGPAHIRIGGSVFYREDDILAFETRMRSVEGSAR